MNEEQLDQDLVGGCAATIAIGAWSCAMYFVFPLAGWSKWLAVVVGATATISYLLILAASRHLRAAAGATYLRRIEREKLAAAGPELTDERTNEIKESWSAATPPGGAHA